MITSLITNRPDSEEAIKIKGIYSITNGDKILEYIEGTLGNIRLFLREKYGGGDNLKIERIKVFDLTPEKLFEGLELSRKYRRQKARLKQLEEKIDEAYKQRRSELGISEWSWRLK